VAALVTETLTPTRKPVDADTDGALGRPWNVIVLNDHHNTFQGVAFALASTIPGVDYDRGMALANRIHNTGRAVVWSGHKEAAESYWERLWSCGLTMGPLEPGT
jgi:ATP-dependent Clp protease adaptor protein ClpS